MYVVRTTVDKVTLWKKKRTKLIKILLIGVKTSALIAEMWKWMNYALNVVVVEKS